MKYDYNRKSAGFNFYNNPFETDWSGLTDPEWS